MKAILFLVFLICINSIFGQNISVKEYYHSSSNASAPISLKVVNPGDTVTFQIAIKENLEDDYTISPFVDAYGANIFRGLKIPRYRANLSRGYTQLQTIPIYNLRKLDKA